MRAHFSNGYQAFAAALFQCLSCVFPAACQSEARVNSGEDRSSADTTEAATLLELANPTAAQRIGPEVTEPGQQKFVQVAILAVSNPARDPLSFEVRFRDSAGQEILLGGFALFPADNPGTFLVATQGKLRAGGTVLVTMLAPQASKGTIRVTVGSIRFTQ